MTKTESLETIVKIMKIGSRRLVKWEHEFISTIKRQIESGYSLSVPQSKTLISIYEKASKGKISPPV